MRQTVPELVAAYELKNQTSFFSNKSMNRPPLSQLLATFQLAAMHFHADETSDHKRQAMDQAETEYNQALLDTTDPEPVAVADQPKKTDVEILQAIVDELDQAYQEKESQLEKLATRCAGLEDEKKALADECKQLYADKMALVEEVHSLNKQLIEKEPKVNELEKSPLSAKPATVESAPAVTPEPAPAAPAPRPLTGAAKAAAEKAAAKAAAAATESGTEETKKNS